MNDLELLFAIYSFDHELLECTCVENIVDIPLECNLVSLEWLVPFLVLKYQYS